MPVDVRETNIVESYAPSKYWDQDAWFMGTDLDVANCYDIADANANLWKTDFLAGGAVHVPVHVYGVDIAGRDLGFFNGQTQPQVALVDVDQDSWVMIGFQADDQPAIQIGGSATTLYLPNIQATQVTIYSAENFLYLTESDQTDPAGRYRFRLSSDVLYLEDSTGASWASDNDLQTWAPTVITMGVDVDMGGFDLDNCGFIILNAATAPASTEVYIVHDNSGDLTLNALSGKSINLAIDGADEVTLTASALSPATSDGNALGTTALMWSDLFLASGGVINFSNGDSTIEHQTSWAGQLLVTGKTAFGGFTDWGAGATGVEITGAGYDWVTQTIGRVNTDITDTAAAAYHALSITISQSHTSFFGTWTELYLSNSVNMTGADNVAAVWGQIEAGTNVTLSDTGCFTAGGYFNVKAGSTLVVATGHSVNGVRVQLEVAAVTMNGKSAAFECLKSGGVDWDYGLYLEDVTTDIRLDDGATILGDNTGDATINVLTGKSFHISINGTDEYDFSATTLAMNANTITEAGDIICNDAAGPTLQDEAATTTNPTLIPNRADETTGIGWNTAEIHIVISGGDEYGFSTSTLDMNANTITECGTITANDAAGPTIVNEAATSTNPTLCPNRAEDDTGIGWASDVIHIVLGGASEYSFSTTILEMNDNALDNCGYIILNAATSPAATEAHLTNITNNVMLNATTGNQINFAIANTSVLRVYSDRVFFFQDIFTDRWQWMPTNTLIGSGVANGGGLTATATHNTGYGYVAFTGITSASFTTAVGSRVLVSLTSGDANTAIGYFTLRLVTTGAGNTALGHQAGDNITTGSYNTIIGYNVDAPSATANYQIEIGDGVNQGRLRSDNAGDWTVYSPSGKVIKFQPDGDTTDYVTLDTVSDVPTWYATGSYMRFGDAATTQFSLASEDDVMVSGILESYGGIRVADDALVILGTTSDQVFLNKTATTSADEELTNIIEGTSVHPATAADTLIISNVTNDGDILILASDGGNSKAFIFCDASTPDLYLYNVGGTWTAGATAWQIPAVTLGGTVTGGNQTLNNLGHIGVANTAADADYMLYGLKVMTDTDNSVKAGVVISLQGAKTTAAFTTEMYGLLANCYVDSTNTQNWTTAFGMTGVMGYAATESGATGTITGMAALRAGNLINGGAANAVVTNLYMLYLGGASLVANSRLTNMYGIYMEDIAGGATLDYGIYIAGASTAAIYIAADPLQFGGANDIVIVANTAAALEISNGTTKLLTFDTRNTVTVENVKFITPASQTLPDGATSRMRAISQADFTVTLVGTTQVTTLNQGMSLCLGAPTINQSGGAVTVDQASTLHVPVITAGANVTITANRMISTGVADCYLTNTGVWTDTVSTIKVKRDVHEFDLLMTVPYLIDELQPKMFKYNGHFSGDFDRQRYGLIAEEFPDFLRVPGDSSESAINASVLANFALVGIKYAKSEIDILKEKVAELEAELATLRN